MRVALTGITGFVGTVLLAQLQAEAPQNEYLTLNLDVEEARQKFPESRYPNFKHVSTEDLEALVGFDPELVLHLATLTTARNDTDIIRPMLAANIEFGVLLLDALQRCPSLRLVVNTGSFAEYRFGPHRLDSAYLYTATKTAFRAFLDYYAHLGRGFRYITAIPYSVYGGRMTVKRLFDYLRESQEATEPVAMTAGEQVLDFVHVEDVAAFFTRTVTHTREFLSLSENGCEFHLGTGRGTSIREVATLMELQSGRTCNINWGGLPYRDRDIMHAVAPVGRNACCGWKARIGLKEGIARFLSDT